MIGAVKAAPITSSFLVETIMTRFFWELGPKKGPFPGIFLTLLVQT
jgi:hypothetical protein